VRRRNHRKSLTDRIVRAALGTAIPEHRAAIAAEPFTLGIFRTHFEQRIERRNRTEYRASRHELKSAFGPSQGF
jgi:hypothetical protein